MCREIVSTQLVRWQHRAVRPATMTETRVSWPFEVCGTERIALLWTRRHHHAGNAVVHRRLQPIPTIAHVSGDLGICGNNRLRKTDFGAQSPHFIDVERRTKRLAGGCHDLGERWDSRWQRSRMAAKREHELAGWRQ